MRKVHQQILVNVDGQSVAVSALVFGDYAVHQAVMSTGLKSDWYSVTVLHNGLKVADYTSKKVAINFAKELERKYDLSPITEAILSGRPIPPAIQALIDEIRQRRLHATYIDEDVPPVEYTAETIRQFHKGTEQQGSQS